MASVWAARVSRARPQLGTAGAEAGALGRGVPGIARAALEATCSSTDSSALSHQQSYIHTMKYTTLQEGRTTQHEATQMGPTHGAGEPREVTAGASRGSF